LALLSDFFKGSDTTLGVFYPNHHLVAVFPDPETAQQVAARLGTAGFVTDDVIAVAGKDVIELDKQEKGIAGLLMQALSRFFATEQVYTDHDLEHARQGAGFLAVHCRDEKAKDKAWEIIKAADPLDARYYARGGVEHLAGDRDTN
jgi:hypothetical protein